MCVCKFEAFWWQKKGRATLTSACVREEFPQSGANSNLLLQGEKVYCQFSFVVSLKRFAAVSIKKHRSKKTPPTEIPTNECQEKESKRTTN